MNEMHEFSIIVPTYQEANNIPLLVARIAAMQFMQRFEVLLMDDDSQDGTFEVVAQLHQQYPWLVLMNCQGERDLSRAVLLGIQYAKFPIVITMDADLSHPPEKITEMLTVLAEPDVEIVIGSRYIKGGSVDARWPLSRLIISRLSALLARPLVAAKDPLSGFIAMRKASFLQGALLKPMSWKIGLEIIVKNDCRHIREIPIHFSERTIGISKLNMKQGIHYLHHLVMLFIYKFFVSRRK